MKRLAAIVFTGILLIALTAFFAPRVTDRLLTSAPSEAASQPETLELTIPTAQPAVITPNIQTFVTLTSTLSDSTIRRPRLQFYNPSNGQWSTIKVLADNGKGVDSAKNDRVFTLRLRFVSASGMTEIALPSKNRVRIKGSVPSPAQLRIAATRKGQLGTLISPTFALDEAPPLAMTIGDETATATVMVPQTIDFSQASDPARVFLKKGGPDGYAIQIETGQNLTDLPLTEWIELNTFSGLDHSGGFVPLVAAGLRGYRYELTEEAGGALYIWLNDQGTHQVFTFTVAPTGGEQDDTFDDNMPEIMSIIDSFQR